MKFIKWLKHLLKLDLLDEVIEDVDKTTGNKRLDIKDDDYDPTPTMFVGM